MLVSIDLSASEPSARRCVQARAFYGFQIAIENIHSEMYSLMVDAYVKDAQEKDRLFHAIDNFESVRRKADWALKWLGRCAWALSGVPDLEQCADRASSVLDESSLVTDAPPRCAPSH